MKSPPSKIVQLVSHREDERLQTLLALCEDGSMWCDTPTGWQCISDPHKPEGDAL